MVKITKQNILIYIRICGTIKEVQRGKINKPIWIKKCKKTRKMYWHYENNMVR